MEGELLKGLIASGPLAGVLAFACWKLWQDNQNLRAELLGVLKEILKLEKKEGP